MQSLVGWCLKNRSVVILATVLLIAGGVYGTTKLNQEFFPEFEAPIVVVTTSVPGASPETVDEQVTRPVESAIEGVNGVSGMQSTSSQGASSVEVEFAYGTDLDAAEADLNSSLEGVALPEGAGDAEVSRVSLDQIPLESFSLSADGDDAGSENEKLGSYDDSDLLGLTAYAQGEIIPRLEEVEGVSRVDLSGGAERRMEIRLDPEALRNNDLDPTVIVGALQESGASLPAGTTRIDGLIAAVQTTSGVEALEDIRVGGDAGNPVTLDDVADIEEVESSPSGISRTNGEPSLGISIYKDSGANEVEVADGVGRTLEGFREDLGDEGQIRVVYSSAEFTREAIGDLTSKAIIGAIAAIAIIFLFLRSIRATLVTAVSLPASVLAALLFSWGADLTLNIITLAGLTIAIGRVVDDAIVVLENAYRYLQEGYSPDEAAIKGTTQVASAVTSSTLVTVAVFLPLGLIGGQVGELFLPLAITVSVALLASLIVAVTIIPVLASLFLKRRATEDGSPTAPVERDGWLLRLYTRLLRWSLRFRVVVLFLALVVFVAGLGMAASLPVQFVPPTEQRQLTAEVELPPGTPESETSDRLRPFEDFMRDDNGIESYQVSVGRSDISGNVTVTNTGTANITVEEGESVSDARSRLEDEGNDLYGDGSFRVFSQLDAGTGAGGELEATITGGSDEELRRATDRVTDEISDNPDVNNVESDLSGGAPTVNVIVNPEDAAAAGLSLTTVNEAVAVYLGSDDAEAASDVPPVVTPQGSVDSLEEVRDLLLGNGVTVGDVATVTEAEAPTEVRRSDGERAVTVTGIITAQNREAVSTEVQTALDDLDLPGDMTASVGGETEDIQQGFGDLFFSIGAALALVYLALVVFFRSVLTPLVVLLAVPLTTAGAFGTQLLTGTALSTSSLLGILLLVGIVVANSILLIDFARNERSRHAPVNDALIEAGRTRIRPILMTALATIFALLPLALGLGGGLLITNGLAIPVIGGLVTSTLLTLLVVPAAYSLLESIREWTRRPKRRRKPETTPTETAPEDVESGSNGRITVPDDRERMERMQYELGRAQGRTEVLERTLENERRERGLAGLLERLRR